MNSEALQKKAQEEVEHLLPQLERDLSLPNGFCSHLLYGDDWSFIIKTHALIETAVTYSMTRLVSTPALVPFFETLALNGRTSKLRVLECLTQIESPFRRFVKQLSRLRNLLVHDIKLTTFSLRNHVHGLPPSELQEWIQAFADTSDDKKRVPGLTRYRDGLFMLAPKEMILLTTKFWLARLYLGVQLQLSEMLEGLQKLSEEK